MTPPAFELEAFGWTAPDRLELSGRWSGVRGVLFVRPTLVLFAGEEHRRLLADLAGKPWPPAGDGRWDVAFPWQGEPLEAELAELTVAPGIVVHLPGPVGGRPRRPVTSLRAAEPHAAGGGTRGILQRAADAERAERDLAAERAGRTRLERELAALGAERDALRRERDHLVRERDDAVAARDTAVRERDGALVVRDRLERERTALVEDRDALRRALERRG